MTRYKVYSAWCRIIGLRYRVHSMMRFLVYWKWYTYNYLFDSTELTENISLYTFNAVYVVLRLRSKEPGLSESQ